MKEDKLEEYIKKELYDNIENPWEFVLEVTDMYKVEFAKTSKIGQPPRIEDVLTKAIKIRLGEDVSGDAGIDVIGGIPE